MRNCEHCALPLVPDAQMELDPDLCELCARTYWETLMAEMAKWPRMPEAAATDDPPPLY